MTENVRKIFEILGVEPNEKFKIEDTRFKVSGIEEHTYRINEQLYIEEDNGILRSQKILFNLLNGSYKIIKLPKKKKLKDLTPEEFDKWQRKNCDYIDCRKCIFTNVICYGSSEKESWIHHKDLYSDKFLDQEIEVGE